MPTLAAQNKRNRIFNVLTSLCVIPKTSLDKNATKKEISVMHKLQFVPNFKFVWDEPAERYRLYIEVARTGDVKENAGYAICNIGSPLAAAGFCTMYSFLYKERANNRAAE